MKLSSALIVLPVTYALSLGIHAEDAIIKAACAPNNEVIFRIKSWGFWTYRREGTVESTSDAGCRVKVKRNGKVVKTKDYPWSSMTSFAAKAPAKAMPAGPSVDKGKRWRFSLPSMKMVKSAPNKETAQPETATKAIDAKTGVKPPPITAAAAAVGSEVVTESQARSALTNPSPPATTSSATPQAPPKPYNLASNGRSGESLSVD